MSRAALLLAACLAAGCGDEDTGPSPALRQDIDALRRLMIGDPARQPLEEVEAVAEGRPVEASRRLRTGAIPAAREQVERAEALELRSPEGRRFHRRLLRAYRDRVGALERYADVLEGAASDTDGLLASVREQAEIELAVMAVDADMEELAPTAPPTPAGGPEEEGPGGEGEAEAPGPPPGLR